MSSFEVGSRVWCVRNADASTVYAFGYGTYHGDEPMPGWDHPDELAQAAAAIRRHDERPVFDPQRQHEHFISSGRMSREEADQWLARAQATLEADRARPVEDRARELAYQMGLNPVIDLEQGGYVWGAECWWGPAGDEDMARFAKGRTIVEVRRPARGIRWVRWEGKKLPAGAKLVTRSSRFGNPYRAADEHGGKEAAVSRFANFLINRRNPPPGWVNPFPAYPSDEDIRDQLAGHDLACACEEATPCHRDILLVLANGPAQ